MPEIVFKDELNTQIGKERRIVHAMQPDTNSDITDLIKHYEKLRIL